MTDPRHPSPRLRRVCVYAGSNPGADPRFRRGAEELARSLVSAGLGIVYGGGNVGLMSALADTALAAGGEVIGIIPAALEDRELAHRGVTELIVVGSMHERKARMAELADAFIALPGGIGTLEELVEMFTWAQLGLHDKPVSLLNVAGYWDGLLALLDHAVVQRFLRAEHRAMLLHDSDPERLLAALQRWRPPRVHRWIDPSRA